MALIEARPGDADDDSERASPCGAADRPSASVIVCTRDRLSFLRTCLASLQHQLVGLPTFEVVVVDNGSTDGTALFLAAWASADPSRHVVVEEPSVGLSRARNRGIAMARGCIVLFLDDDAMAPQGWVAAHVLSYRRRPEVDAVGGPIVLAWPAGRPAWVTQRLEHWFSALDLGDEPRPFPTRHGPYGTNMSIRRSRRTRARGLLGRPRQERSVPALGRRSSAVVAPPGTRRPHLVRTLVLGGPPGRAGSAHASMDPATWPGAGANQRPVGRARSPRHRRRQQVSRRRPADGGRIPPARQDGARRERDLDGCGRRVGQARGARGGSARARPSVVARHARQTTVGLASRPMTSHPCPSSLPTPVVARQASRPTVRPNAVSPARTSLDVRARMSANRAATNGAIASGESTSAMCSCARRPTRAASSRFS